MPPQMLRFPIASADCDQVGLGLRQDSASAVNPKRSQQGKSRPGDLKRHAVDGFQKEDLRVPAPLGRAADAPSSCRSPRQAQANSADELNSASSILPCPCEMPGATQCQAADAGVCGPAGLVCSVKIAPAVTARRKNSGSRKRSQSMPTLPGGGAKRNE